MWTLDEWEQIARSERPAGAGFIPGVGYFRLRNAEPHQRREIATAAAHAQQEHEFSRSFDLDD